VHPNDAEWDAWRPEAVAARLEHVTVPWAIAAGWAIDLFLGYERREHEDLEIAVPATRFAEVEAALPELDLHVVGPGPAVPVRDAGPLLETHHQTWGLDRVARVWRLDVFREPSVDGRWVCRRDESLRLPYDELIERSADGIPYVRPEVVLLFKAKGARPKDEGDLAAVLPRLPRSRRRWLAEAIDRAHPGHFWLADVHG
jgi:hypothetical protein